MALKDNLTYVRHSMASLYIVYIYLILSQSNENLKSKIPRRQNIFKIRSDNSGNKDKFDIRRTYMDNCSLSWLGIGISIKSDGVQLVFWSKGQCM